MGAIFCTAVLTIWSMSSPNNHMAAPVKVAPHQNIPEPSEPCLRNLHQHAPEPSGTFGNLPPEPSGTCLSTHRKTLRNLPPEPASRTCLRNLPPEPTPASATYTSTLELSGTLSGTCSCDAHRHTPELIWAEDPVSLRSWGTNSTVLL